MAGDASPDPRLIASAIRGRLAYAWIDGEQRGHGAGVFGRAWPVSLLKQLEGVIGDR